MKTEISRIFRPERPLRGNTNIRPQQPIDEAAWIWAPGLDHWGGAIFSETRTTPEVLARLPQTFLRFRREFEAESGADARDEADDQLRNDASFCFSTARKSAAGRTGACPTAGIAMPIASRTSRPGGIGWRRSAGRSASTRRWRNVRCGAASS